jgi:zeaxanthin glucosyltransferase
VAARIAAHQTGVVASLENLSASGLATLVKEVLNNPRYRVNAVKFQQAIAETNGLSRAADLLEEGFGLTKKCRE